MGVKDNELEPSFAEAALGAERCFAAFEIGTPDLEPAFTVRALDVETAALFD